MKLTAHAERGTGWWVVEVPELPGLFTQTRRLDQVPGMVRDAAAALTGDPEESFDVDVVPTIEAALRERILRAEELSAKAKQIQLDASELNRSLARELHSNGYTVRDIGAVLHVSHQRADQLLKA